MAQGHQQSCPRHFVENPHKNLHSTYNKEQLLHTIKAKVQKFSKMRVLKYATERGIHEIPGHYHCFKSLKNLKEKFFAMLNVCKT